MDKITEIIPDDIPQWAAEAIDRGDFFKVAIAKAEAADKHQTEQAEASNLNAGLYGMKLHECKELWKGMEVVRVPGGWLYNTYQENGTGGYDQTMCFVPYNNEYWEAV